MRIDLPASIQSQFSRISLLVLFSAALAILPACKKSTTHEDRFSSADLDKNGLLTLEEVSDYFITGLFSSLDKDGDAKLTAEEWSASHDAGQAGVFAERDANKDGVLTIPEAVKYARTKGMVAQVFNEVDTNSDKLVSREEALAYYGSKE